jgi:SAM-dependent methyltransferase
MSIYYHDEGIHNVETPRLVVPLLLQYIQPESVLDVGCGIGTWLKAFEENGIVDFLGMDGNHVDQRRLKISPVNFKIQNLTHPWDLHRRFDLAACLEVAEHLPASASELLVEMLVKHSDSILFSAAIPGQGGQNHLNEQWPAYWQTKFKTHGFYFHDIIRPLIWDNNDIQWWYRQNIFLVNKQPNDKPMLSLVHPELFGKRTKMLEDIHAGEIGIQQGFKILMDTLKKRLAVKSRKLE